VSWSGYRGFTKVLKRNEKKRLEVLVSQFFVDSGFEISNSQFEI